MSLKIDKQYTPFPKPSRKRKSSVKKAAKSDRAIKRLKIPKKLQNTARHSRLQTLRQSTQAKSAQKTPYNLQNLPQDLQGYIASFLPLKTQAALNCVSKTTFECEDLPGLPFISEINFDANSQLSYKKIKLYIKKYGTNFRSLNLSHRKNLRKRLFFLISKHCQNNLTELNISSCRISSELIKKFAPYIGTLKKIEKLNLSYNSILERGALAFAPHLKNMSHLKELNLKFNGINLQGIEAFARQSKSLKLTTLNLSWNSIGSAEGAQHLATIIKTQKYLETLILTWNFLKGNGVRTIQPALANHPNLKRVNLSNNQISDSYAQKLPSELSGIDQVILCNQRVSLVHG